MASRRELVDMLDVMCRMIAAGNPIVAGGSTLFRAEALVASERRGNQTDIPWTPFMSSAAPVGMGFSECWINSRYHVLVSHRHHEGFVYLSIRRIDQAPIHNWRDLWRIKNEIVGPDHEGVELYPAVERVIDEANQYHLWVYADRRIRIPLGWRERKVGTPEEAARDGARQEPFEDGAFAATAPPLA